MRDRSIELLLTKKEEGPYWPQLFKEKKKMHWLKVDFNRWRDEDDSEPEGENEEQDINEVRNICCTSSHFDLPLHNFFTA